MQIRRHLARVGCLLQSFVFRVPSTQDAFGVLEQVFRRVVVVIAVGFGRFYVSQIGYCFGRDLELSLQTFAFVDESRFAIAQRIPQALLLVTEIDLRPFDIVADPSFLVRVDRFRSLDLFPQRPFRFIKRFAVLEVVRIKSCDPFEDGAGKGFDVQGFELETRLLGKCILLNGRDLVDQVRDERRRVTGLDNVLEFGDALYR